MSRKLLAFLVKLDEPPKLTTVMACSARRLSINNIPVSFGNMADALAHLARSPGKLTVEGQGVFPNVLGKGLTERWHSSGSVRTGAIYIDGGLLLRGEFMCRSLEYHGCINGEDVWNIVVESIGGVNVG